MIKHCLATLAAATMLAGAAQAADLAAARAPAPYVPAASPVYNWTGVYLGANVGYGWGSLSVGTVSDFDGDDTVTYTYPGNKLKPDGVFGGGQIGFNYQLPNNIVLGIEADLQLAGLKDTNNRNDEAKLDYFGTVRARAGYAFDRVLPYLTTGFAYAHGKGTLNYGDLGSVSDKRTFYGWTVGGGVEYAMTNNITLKLEYLYADLGKEKFSWSNPYDHDVSAKLDGSLSTIKFGVNYKF